MLCCRYDYELVFGTDVKGMDKAERLLFRDSLMTHAMVLTGVSVEVSLIFILSWCAYSYTPGPLSIVTL